MPARTPNLFRSQTAQTPQPIDPENPPEFPTLGELRALSEINRKSVQELQAWFDSTKPSDVGYSETRENLAKRFLYECSRILFVFTENCPELKALLQEKKYSEVWETYVKETEFPLIEPCPAGISTFEQLMGTFCAGKYQRRVDAGLRNEPETQKFLEEALARGVADPRPSIPELQVSYMNLAAPAA